MNERTRGYRRALLASAPMIQRPTVEETAREAAQTVIAASIRLNVTIAAILRLANVDRSMFERWKAGLAAPNLRTFRSVEMAIRWIDLNMRPPQVTEIVP